MTRSAWLSLYLAVRPRPAGEVARSARPTGPVLWCHANSSARASGLLEVAERLRDERDELSVLISTHGDEARLFLEARGVSHDPARGLWTAQLSEDDPELAAHWQPEVALWSGAPEHPALLKSLKEQGARMILTDASPPRRPLSAFMRVPGLQRSVLSLFDRISAHEEEARSWLNSLAPGVDRIERIGPLRHGRAVAPCDQSAHARLTEKIGTRPVWLADHPSIEEIPLMLQAHQRAMRSTHRRLLLIIPHRECDVASLRKIFSEQGIDAAFEVEGGTPDVEAKVLVTSADASPDLWYRLAPITFVGGSFSNRAPTDPFGPASLGSVVLHGPQTGSFAAAFRALDDAGAALCVRDVAELGNALEQFIAPDKAARMASNAWQVISAGAEVVDRLVDIIGAALDDAPAGRA